MATHEVKKGGHDLIRTGWMMMGKEKKGCFSRTVCNRYFFVLKGQFLYYYQKQDPESYQNSKVTGKIHLTPDFGFDLEFQTFGCKDSQDNLVKRQIAIYSKDKTYRLVAESVAEAKEWIVCMKWQSLEVSRNKLQDKVYDATLFKKDNEDFGLELCLGFNSSLPNEKSVILIRSITEGSAAAMFGTLEKSDIITHINGESMTGATVEYAIRQLNESKNIVNLNVSRKRKPRRASKVTPLSLVVEEISIAEESIAHPRDGVHRGVVVGSPRPYHKESL